MAPQDTNSSTPYTPSGREIFEACFSGAQYPPCIPRLRSDPIPQYHPLPHSLSEFRSEEGRTYRKHRLMAMYKHLHRYSRHDHHHTQADAAKAWLNDNVTITPERATELEAFYESELIGVCGGGELRWKVFKEYALAKEAELWSIFHDELDLDGNGHLDSQELDVALRKAGIDLSPATLADFMASLASSPHSHAVTFSEFRDFLLLLPRKVSAAEIYKYYEVKRYMGDDGKGAARVTMEGDVSLSAEDKPPDIRYSRTPPLSHVPVPATETLDDEDEDLFEDEEEEAQQWLEGHTALKFLLAGGIAGAVSRTCTAPFDRLKVFLITRPPDLLGGATSSQTKIGGIKVIGSAVARIYAEGGILAFWVGNGLSVAKIFPESAIKFFAYESSKRAFAKYWDGVNDPREISGVSRFLSGGIGGISSQLSIYPIETLKTQMMSNTGEQKRTLAQACRHLWSLGGVRAYYRGLTIGLVGVFPYAAIDMSTFEALKLAYLRSTGKDEPGVMATLAFGSLSGSVGATTVYPLNLVRTRLQASGSSGHPQRYTGVFDVAMKTWERDGWRGFYRGLFPTLAKVVPAVSISYVVYEQSKRSLGV